MIIHTTGIKDVVLVQPHVFTDERGFFLEVFHEPKFQRLGLPDRFVQDNHSRSGRGTVRGLHYQIRCPQGKLIRVARGEIFDVAVDLRRYSVTFGRWTGFWLNDENCHQLYVPPGFAHGFCVTSELADVVYKCTEIYQPEYERTIAWNDHQLAIDWPIQDPILGAKDKRGMPFSKATVFDNLQELSHA